MTRWAVSHIDWFDHNLVTEIIEANSQREAIIRHSKINGMDDPSDMPEAIEDIKLWFWDQDSMVEAISIPEIGDDPRG